MTLLSTPAGLLPQLGLAQGRVRFGAAALAALPPTGRLRDNPLVRNPLSGGITDRVMFKETPSSPEVPFANGRVWLLRLIDGYKAWEGYSNAQGYYAAEGLELGIEYIAVGIDPYRSNKATGAGPVVATLPGAAP